MSLAALQHAIEQHPDIQLAYIFGSLAKGTARPESDADIALQTTMPLTPASKMKLIEDFAQITGRPIDLIDLRHVGEPLLGQILQHGIRVKGSNSQHAEMMKKDLFDSADFLPYARRMLRERREKWTR